MADYMTTQAVILCIKDDSFTTGAGEEVVRTYAYRQGAQVDTDQIYGSAITKLLASKEVIQQCKADGISFPSNVEIDFDVEPNAKDEARMRVLSIRKLGQPAKAQKQG
jgi:hypothetical protein